MQVKKSECSISTSNSIELHYERARSELIIASLPLTFASTTIKQLEHFIDAALALHNTCNDSNAFENPLDVLFWLRRRLNQEAKKSERNEDYRARCLRGATEVEHKIASACTELSQGGLTALE